MGGLRQDLRYALRNLGRSPGFATTVLATLALASGAVVAIFSVAHAVLLKPLPYRDPDRLVRIGHVQGEASKRPGSSFSPQDFEDLEADHSGLDGVAAYSYFPNLSGKNLTGAGEPDRIVEAEVSGSFFSLLGAPALEGRTLEPPDDRLGSNQEVVLSYGLWHRRFSADRSIVGRTVQLDGKPYTVVGVMPPPFALPAAEVEAWVPLSTVTDDDVPHQRGIRWISVLGRLSPGADAAAVRARLDTLFSRLASKYPESNTGFHRALVVPLSEAVVGDVRPAILVLFGAVCLVLLIAATNVANLLLARASVREREVAIRSALGAPRSRIVRQFLTESLVLALAGGALGLLLASWGVDALVSLASAYVPRAAEIGIDTGVL
ncbi:MAG: ABC transporter permease, partial [Thermoanaerobaculia bacterium]